MPVAVSCRVVPSESNWFAGLTVIDDRAAELTDKPVEPVTEPEVAEIVVGPAPIAFTKPGAETVAIVGTEEFHVAEPVRSCVLPSL